MTAEPAPGQTFGPFQLERRLGAGAFAEVWLAVEGGSLGFRSEAGECAARASGPRQPVAATPTPEPTPGIIGAAPLPSCLGFVSSPVGAEVFVDGGRIASRARSTEGAWASRPPGAVHVGMGLGGEVLAEIALDAQPGRIHVVRCSLGASPSCSATDRAGACP